MNGSLFNSQNLGRTPFYFWYGMVVGGSEWEDNQKDEAISQHKIHDRDDVAGWGHRCKVAIMGYDPRIVDDKTAKNSELVMAEVMVPPTGGGGVGGPVMTPTLGNNSFVVGFFKDGVSAREPIIMGVLPNVSQSRMKPYDTPERTRYDATTGYRPGEDPVANDALWGDGDKMETGEKVRPYTIMLQAQKEDGDRSFGIPSIERCQGTSGALSGIQGLIQQMMNGINLVKSGVSSFTNAASDAAKNINAIMATTSNLISAIIRDTVGVMRGQVLNQVNDATKIALDLLPPNLVSPTIDTAIAPAIDGLTCVFNGIMNSARGLVGNFLGKLLGGAANSFLSTAGALVGDFLTNTLGGITSAIDGVISTIDSVAGKALEFLGNPLSALGSVFGLINIFGCQDLQYCPAITEWNFLYGTNKTSTSFSGGQTDVSSFYNPATSPTAEQSTAGAFPVLSGPPVMNVTGGGQEPAFQPQTTNSPQPISQLRAATAQREAAGPQVGQQANAEAQSFVNQERNIAATGNV